MKSKSNPLELESTDQFILAASLLKEHHEFRIDQLLSNLAEDIYDEAHLQDFQKFNLQSELRHTIQENEGRHELRESQEYSTFWKTASHGHGEDALNSSKGAQSREGLNLSSEQEKSKLGEINSLASEASKENQAYQDRFERIQQFMIKLYKQIHSIATLQRMAHPQPHQDKQPANYTQDYVTIPKSQHESLIQVYSVCVADSSLRALKDSLCTSTERKQCEASKGSDLKISSELHQKSLRSVSDLQTFFSTLAQRLGFSSEWQRYQREHANKSIQLCNTIDRILNKQPCLPKAEQINKLVELPEQILKSKESKFDMQQHQSRLFNKITLLIHRLDFTQEERNVWSQFRTKLSSFEILNQIGLTSKSAKHSQLADLFCEVISSTTGKIKQMLAMRDPSVAFNNQKDKSVLKQYQQIIEKAMEKDEWNEAAQYLKKEVQKGIDKVAKKTIFMSLSRIVDTH